MDREDSEEEEKEGETDFLPIVLPHPEQPSEPTPSDVVARVLGELAPVEVVVESSSRVLG